MSKSSNAKRAAARFEARKVRSRTRKIRLQQVLSNASSAASLTHKRLKKLGFSSQFLQQQKKGVRSAKAKLARKALLGNFQKIVG